jgi:uncharacterized protein (DUF885 family)
MIFYKKQTMKKTLILAAFLLGFLACKDDSKSVSKDGKKLESIDNIFKNYYKEKLQLFPLDATSNGNNDYNDKLNIDISGSFRDSMQRFFLKYKALLATYDKTKLSADESTSFDILNWELDESIAGLKFKDNLMPINQFWAFTLTLGQLGSGDGNQPFKTAADYDNWLKRVSVFPAWADTAITNMRLGIQEKWTIPTVLAVKVVPQLESMVVADPTKSLFYQPLVKLATITTITPAEKAAITAKYLVAINTQITPTYKKLTDFFKNEYLPKCRKTGGIDGVNGGGDYYKHLIKYWTTTDMTSDEVFALGLQEVERIRWEMEKVKQQVGFKGNLKSFFKYVSDDAKFRPYKDASEVIAGFHKIEATMKPRLDSLFDMKPKTPFEIRRTEAFREKSGSAEYNQGSADGSRPGIFYVPVPEVKKYNVFQDEALFLHEAIPGHHYQISIQQENKNLPDFRKFLWYGAYGEGWALYTESLGNELGLYKDPYQYFGKLGMEMHRALRLVIDVGLHAKGWTRDQAVKYDLENEAESYDGVVAEVERYMAIPGQALSYKVGQLKILSLKAKAEKALGKNFDIKKFHNTVLKDGCLPLAILEKKIDGYIASELERLKK